MTIPQIFLLVGLANAVVASYIFMLVPEYLLRFIAWIVSRLVYRFKVTGDEHIPVAGRRDPGVQPRELRRCRAADGGQPAADPLPHGPPHLQGAGAGLGVQAGQGHSRSRRARKIRRPTKRRSTRRRKVLREGDLLAIFPEGAITHDGSLQEFKGGIMKILEREPAPVIPMALINLWGSFFSRVEAGRRDGAAVPARAVQPGGAERWPSACARPGGSRGIAQAGRAAARRSNGVVLQAPRRSHGGVRGVCDDAGRQRRAGERPWRMEPVPLDVFLRKDCWPSPVSQPWRTARDTTPPHHVRRTRLASDRRRIASVAPPKPRRKLCLHAGRPNEKRRMKKRIPRSARSTK